ncbi:MAG TPA: tRNA (adenosine(37)-N6)-threonylcarbamoyltransferase complex dimerization subunit type 1 TsaB [Bacillales bacterium]|nr:tRNA (adenosine(37)-N6)-threonylcarbamoyltransferase complex dimerization subunit type 1 TsaB [Bacillales bacterium]
MKTLAIDTSNQTMGVALADNGVVLGEIVTHLKKNHSVRLMPAVDTVLKETGVMPAQLERIAVAEGPGSYTGVRIGVTVAKTFAWALGIPLVGVSSLEVLAQNGQRFGGYVSPLFDARRGQVYTGLYANENGRFGNVKLDRITLLSDWLDLLESEREPVLFVGHDLAKHAEEIADRLGSLAVFARSGEQAPRPGELAILGEQRAAEESAHRFVPEYRQLAEAESKWLAAQEQKKHG